MIENPFRLLQLFNRAQGGGGEELAVTQIAHILKKECRYDECIFQSNDWTGANAPPLWKQAAYTFYNPNSVRAIRQTQNRLQAQAWILHNFIPVGSPGIHCEALRQKIPIIQYIHNFRPFSVSGYLWIGRNLNPAKWPQNYLQEIRHGAWQNSKFKTAFLASMLVTMHLFNLFRAIKVWVAVSDFMRQKFILAGVPPEKIFRLYNPWTLRHREEPNFAEGNYYIFLGRLIEEKGIKVVVNAWNLLRQMQPANPPKLVIGGDGPLTDWVKEAAEKNSLIEYRGYITGEEKQSLLEGCRGLAAPSIWWDPLPYVTYDAYDAGKPVLAAAGGGLTELVQHQITGFHHQPGNAEQLAQQVIEMNSNSDRRREMGKKGRAWLLANTNETVW
ncbi:MAG: glycosyltransferase family 4 protein, partial [Limisphaerales bacterium]